jgi:hypothetical protein
MRNELRPGERIRLTPQVQDRAFRPGQYGIVLAGCRADDSGWLSYYVRLDGQVIGMWNVFTAQEIEQDSDAAARSTVRPSDGAAVARRVRENMLVKGQSLKTRYVNGDC